MYHGKLVPTLVTTHLCFLFVLQRTRASQIIPCTVSQLMSASQADEVFKVGDVEVAQVILSNAILLSNLPWDSVKPAILCLAKFCYL